MKDSITRGAKLLASPLVFLLLTNSAIAQCALCKLALLNSPEGARIAQSFNQGILLLLGAPFLVVGAVAFLICRSHRRDQRGRVDDSSLSTRCRRESVSDTQGPSSS